MAASKNRERERDMAGLLAWAADVVGSGQGNAEDGDDSECLSPEQQKYAGELDQKAAWLRRWVQDLRLRIPPPDISQRLPHLHAHSLASNAALALQLNSHSSTKQQAELREITLEQENDAFRKAISDCENKIQEKLQEADLLQRKLQETDATEENIRAQLGAQAACGKTQVRGGHADPMLPSKTTGEAWADTEALKSDILDKLGEKKKELCSMEEKVQNLEKRWARVQENALKQPSPAQREKILDKQLHSLIAQLEAKQAQAEGLVSDVHAKEMELDRLNGLWRRLESSSMDIARNRHGRNGSMMGSASSDCIVDHRQKPPFYLAGRTENHQRLMLLRSGFVLYILALHIMVFIRISF